MAPSSPLALRRAAAAGLLALLLVAAAVALLIPASGRRQPAAGSAFTLPRPGERRPLLVIDAGSSGTRVHAFLLELAGASGGSSERQRRRRGGREMGRRGGPFHESPSSREGGRRPPPPFAVVGVDVVPASAAPEALPSAGDGKKGMYERVETRPGLDQVVAGPEGRADPEAVLRKRALGPLLDWAAAALPGTTPGSSSSGGSPRAPVFFGGTGGLRRMPPHARDRLLEAARRVLRSDARLAFESGGGTGAHADDALVGPTAAAAAAGVLPGAREAAFGWVATNWARGLLNNAAAASAAGPTTPPPPPPTTVGVLDLGGASLEVAFEVVPEDKLAAAAAAGTTGAAAEEAAEAAVVAAAGGSASVATPADNPFARPASAVVELRVGGAGPVRRVHTHAFHGYGLNEAFDRAVTRLLEEQQRQQQQQQQQQQQEETKQQQGQQRAPDQVGARTTTTSTTAARGPPPLFKKAEKAPPRRRSLAADAPSAAAQGAAAGGHPTGAAAVVVRHPCLHAGYEAPYERIEHRHSHHADPEDEQQQQQQQQQQQADKGRQAPPPTTAAPRGGPAVVTLVGAPDWPACRRLMAAVVDADAPCARRPRSSEGEECRLGALQPALLEGRRRFAALSGFDAVWRFLGADPSGGTAALLAAAERWCAMPWPFDQGPAARLRPDAARSVNSERYCAWAPYAASLLREGLGLADADFDVGGGGGGGGGATSGSKGGDRGSAARLAAVGWPLGAALVEGPRLLEAAAAAAAAAAGGRVAVQQGAAAAPPAARAGRPLSTVLLLFGLLAAGVLLLAIAVLSASSSSPPPPRGGGWVGLGPAAGRGGAGGKGGGGHALPITIQAAPSMLSLRSSSFAQAAAAGTSVASSLGAPRAFATSSSFSFGSSAAAAAAAQQPSLLLSAGGSSGNGGAVPRREASPTMWRSASPVGGGGGALQGSSGSLRGL